MQVLYNSEKASGALWCSLALCVPEKHQVLKITHYPK